MRLSGEVCFAFFASLRDIERAVVLLGPRTVSISGVQALEMRPGRVTVDQNECVETVKYFRNISPWRRWATKTFAFCLLSFFVLNPNLKRLVLQVRHTFAPESLIQTDFAGMQEINRQIDQLIARSPDRSEIKTIEKFVLKRIRYVSDYQTWGNMEYWPTAEEVWQNRQEDCDGRAILAVSILRSRGYPSARLAISLDHMWAEVNSREKQPGLPEEITSILHPDSRFSAALDGKPTANHFARLAKALFRPTAFRDTSANLIAAIPFARKVILLTMLLLLCYHPCRNHALLLVLLCSEWVALSFFAVSDARIVDHQYAILGLACTLVVIAASLAANRIGPLSLLFSRAGSFGSRWNYHPPRQELITNRW